MSERTSSRQGEREQVLRVISCVGCLSVGLSVYRSLPILLVHLPPSERRSGGWTSGMGNERHVCLLGREVSRSTFLGLACRSHSSCFTPFLTPVPLRVTTEGSSEEWVGSDEWSEERTDVRSGTSG